jgi:hypothetical protein
MDTRTSDNAIQWAIDVITATGNKEHGFCITAAPSPSKLAERSSGAGDTSCLGAFSEHLGRLVPTNSSTPLTTVLLVLVRADQNAISTRRDRV